MEWGGMRWVNMSCSWMDLSFISLFYSVAFLVHRAITMERIKVTDLNLSSVWKKDLEHVFLGAEFTCLKILLVNGFLMGVGMMIIDELLLLLQYLPFLSCLQRSDISFCNCFVYQQSHSLCPGACNKPMQRLYPCSFLYSNYSVHLQIIGHAHAQWKRKMALILLASSDSI